MSYDYDFFRVSDNVRTPDDLIEENMKSIGTVAQIRSALRVAFPKANLNDSGGWLDQAASMGDVLFHDATGLSFSVSRIDIPAVQSICRALGVVAFDGQEMTIIRV